MLGEYFKTFYVADDEYVVTKLKDELYGRYFNIYRLDGPNEPELIYTVYRKTALDTFIQNIFDARFEEVMDI